MIMTVELSSNKGEHTSKRSMLSIQNKNGKYKQYDSTCERWSKIF